MTSLIARPMLTPSSKPLTIFPLQRPKIGPVFICRSKADRER